MSSFIRRQELISVIIPVHNASKFINKAINSILKQSYKKIELILIDDGSEDNSLKIINEYKKKYKNIRVISQKNYGAGLARNKGIECAKGAYVMFLDADDFYNKDCCACALEAIQESNADFLSFGANFFNKKNKVFSSFEFENKNLEGTRIIKSYLLGGEIKNVVWNKIYKKVFLEKFGIRFNSLTVNEDSFFIMSACLSAKKISFCSGRFYNHTRMNINSSTNKITYNHFVQTVKLLDAEKLLLTDKDYYTLLRNYFNIHAIRILTYILFAGALSQLKFSDFRNGADVIIKSDHWNEFFKRKVKLLPLHLSLRLRLCKFPALLWLSGRLFIWQTKL
jgi:glycosyltransferase involved in cell wall biosynthesis